ncbi:leucyl/phenylalanyl-tRNA--protein transferase [Celeribacter sp.]|uniref:leucyl/phenylalanyl-tRNA--protein transferase n=1 Tax=Celeribacter sp. TaxID=1890673 RepID=UPI003A8EC39A
MNHVDLTPDLLLTAYANGVFPMADSAESEEIFWLDPHDRGVLPLDGFHISRSLARVIRRETFTITLNRDFRAVMRGCADRETTWINRTIHELYGTLHDEGFAHSIEVWEGERLVGGSYGIALGSAFFGESMFSYATNASKVALAYLTTHLRAKGFTLFDTQFITPHLASLGGEEIPRTAYHARLAQALQKQAEFGRTEELPSPQDVLQASGHTS